MLTCYKNANKQNDQTFWLLTVLFTDRYKLCIYNAQLTTDYWFQAVSLSRRDNAQYYHYEKEKEKTFLFTQRTFSSNFGIVPEQRFQIMFKTCINYKL